MLDHRHAQLVEPLPQGFEHGIAQRHAIEVGAQCHAHDPGSGAHPLQFRQRGLYVGQRQGDDRAQPVEILRHAGNDHVVLLAAGGDPLLGLELVDAGGRQRQYAHVDALAVHVAQQVSGIEHLVPEGEPVAAVSLQEMDPGRAPVDGHARHRLQPVIEGAIGHVAVDVDLHRLGAFNVTGLQNWLMNLVSR